VPKATHTGKSSSRNNWSTPDDLFEYLSDRFGPFTLDAAASEDNRRCKQYLDINTDAFSQHTELWKNQNVFCNPPFGQKSATTGCYGIEAWLALAAMTTAAFDAKWIVFTPSDPSTQYFNKYQHIADAVYMLSPRVQFVPPEGVAASTSPGSPFIFTFGHKNTGDKIQHLVWKEKV
jgi:phage N-6-adenine-methyltransferase